MVLAKTVFRPNEITTNGPQIVLAPPTSFSELAHLAPSEEVEEVLSPLEQYSGPTADDLRREAEAFKAQWEIEKEALISGAHVEAEQIIAAARDEAAGEAELKVKEGEDAKAAAEGEAARIIAEAQEKIVRLEEESRSSLEQEKKEVLEAGRDAGREEGFAQGKGEVERLIQRTQTVLERAQDKRGEILAETEEEIVDLVLLLTRKVVKAITENQRNVILQNVVQALRKVKTRGTVIIRVNMADLKLTTEHIKNFIQMMEGVKGIQVQEDSTVDPGGCIIETDFGEIDARISSQLAELESKILELSPIRARPKAAGKNGPPSAGAGKPAEEA
ncbi:MAG: flagellar assembly protein FliH [Treponema sp.]|jgi:flagellar assembly protein FliH|nr:flagellar assembly protein FliH [Treponema sp.]